MDHRFAGSATEQPAADDYQQNNKDHKNKSLEHLQRMTGSKIRKLPKHYKPKRKRSL
jgi:hypothetical protein